MDKDYKIQEIVSYITSDGLSFDTFENAEIHQASIDSKIECALQFNDYSDARKCVSKKFYDFFDNQLSKDKDYLKNKNYKDLVQIFEDSQDYEKVYYIKEDYFDGKLYSQIKFFSALDNILEYEVGRLILKYEFPNLCKDEETETLLLELVLGSINIEFYCGISELRENISVVQLIKDS